MSQQRARAGHDSIKPRYAEASTSWAGGHDSITAGHDSVNGGHDSIIGGHDPIAGELIAGGHDFNGGHGSIKAVTSVDMTPSTGGHDSINGGHGSIKAVTRSSRVSAVVARLQRGHDSINAGHDSINGGHDSIIGGHDSNTAGARIERSVPLVQVSFSSLVPFSLLPPSLPCAAPPSPSLCLSLRLSCFFSIFCARESLSPSLWLFLLVFLSRSVTLSLSISL